MTAVAGDRPYAPPQPMSLADVERLAADRLPTDVRDFVAGGAGAELTLAANRAALDRLTICPRVLTGKGEANPATRLLGGPAAMPVAAAPMAYQRLLHSDGELALAAAAKSAGVPFVVSTLSSFTVNEIAAVGADTWFQLYWLRDREAVLRLVRRAEDAGCRTLMVTVDVPVMGRRLRDLRNEFTLPGWIGAANLGTGGKSEAHVLRSGGSAVAAHTKSAFQPALSWADVEWLRERTVLPLALKGVLDPRDAVRAVAVGADALVVSNHGGRQFDGAPAAVDALPEISRAVGDRCELLLDSGIRTGTDVLQALALGASGVLLGRPLLWGLALGGEAGAGRVLDLLRTEVEDALTLAGCAGPADARELWIGYADGRRTAPAGETGPTATTAKRGAESA